MCRAGTREQANLCSWCASAACRKGQWQDVAIPLDRFVLTWRGRLVEEDVPLQTAKITSISISIAGGDDASQPPGDFHLGLDYIKGAR